ncbi:MAG: DUF6017 domain-containing protein [Clostridiales bacterium]|nr:DUF6017 domain-containing protein [Clostridiales bacterium]
MVRRYNLVLNRLNKAQTKVKNIKNYLLTALYNAPSDSSFTAVEEYRSNKKMIHFNNSIGRSYDEFDPMNMSLRLTEEFEPHMSI